MEKLHTKNTMDIRFTNRHKRAIVLKRKKENLIYASLMSDAYAQELI